MSGFSLSRKNDLVFPSTVTVEGNTFEIAPDFRNILKVMRIVRDPVIIPSQVPEIVGRLLFGETAPDDPMAALALFISLERKPTDDSRLQRDEASGVAFCYEHDAEEIYASFLKEYDIDLMDGSFLHWFKFRILLSNLSEDTPFRKKLHWRGLDLSEYTGQKNYAAVYAAKEAAQLPETLSGEEQAERDAFEALWGDIGS